MAAIMADHWSRYGRNYHAYYARHDYEDVESPPRSTDGGAARGAARAFRIGDALTITAADDFEYLDPVDGALSGRQGFRLLF